MQRFNTCVLAALFSAAPVFAVAAPLQNTSTSTSQQNSQDVPHQEPGSNNPDVGKQRHPAPRHSTDSTRQKEDVPEQKPGTNNPDVSKQRHHTGKKKSSSTQTSSSTRI